MKQIASGITGLPTAPSSSTGQPPTGTGYGELVPYGKRNPDLYVIVPQPWLNQTISESVASLTTWLMMRRTLPDGAEWSASRAELAAALDGVRRLLLPPTPQEVVLSLNAIASIFRAHLPEEEALRIYVSLFQEIPKAAFKEACRSLAKTHRYPNMPLPAEFFEASKESTATLRMWEDRIVRALARIDKLDHD